MVNTTARLEALTKSYGTGILASREFCEALSQQPRMRIIDEVIVAGKSGQYPGKKNFLFHHDSFAPIPLPGFHKLEESGKIHSLVQNFITP